MAKKKTTKIFVLDTNVILHDHTCIYQFQENDIVIPITVLEELDKFKRGNDPINFQAREFVRELDDIVGEKKFNGGIKLGADKGKLIIMTGKPFSEEMKQSFRKIFLITGSCHCLHNYQENPDRPVILVSKDINLR
jgi:PhoH-like ATPase